VLKQQLLELKEKKREIENQIDGLSVDVLGKLKAEEKELADDIAKFSKLVEDRQGHKENCSNAMQQNEQKLQELRK
jgi:hypothetical protein